MKKLNLILFTFFCATILFSCKNSPEKSGQKSTELATIRSLGLAYLEEFKLEDAEKEFLKFIKLQPEDKFGYANLGLTYLRMAKYPEAEKQLLKAIRMDSMDPDIRLILATVYKMNDERDRAISELIESLSFAPDHIKTLYEITELYSLQQDEGSRKLRKEYLEKLVIDAPANLVPRLSLTEMLVQDGESDKAIEQLEIIQKQFPEFPKEAVGYYDNAMSCLRKNERENSVVQFTIFHNYIKVTSPYQAGIMELKGPGGSLIGFPLITFSEQPSSKVIENESLLNIMKFTNASSAAGLNIVSGFNEEEYPEYKYSTHAEAADFDGDGDIDIYAGCFDQASSAYRHYLLINESGIFRDVSSNAGLKHTGRESSAQFADFDNDGFLDLYISREDGDILYRNSAKGLFENVTANAKLPVTSGGLKALFFDMDHDGDLDLFDIKPTNDLMYRNNADGTFTDNSVKTGLNQGPLKSHDVVFGDFDEDEDIDFIVADEAIGTLFYSNQRQGVFRDVTEKSGLKEAGGSSVVASGDYDNNGYLDLFISSNDGSKNELYRNLQNGTFKPSGIVFPSLNNIKTLDAGFIDFNNDGFLDLVVAGEPLTKNGNGLYLFYNDNKVRFTDVRHLLPPEANDGRQITVFDYNDDGDPDILVANINGGLTLLRNDGGNNNHFIKMKLVGLRAGSAKNNHFGIGAKVEMRAGDLYQSMAVTNPDILFGIGGRAQADVIRIRWTNGVPQNIFLPKSDQALIEAQTLKGSCPFLYTWNGEEFIFVKDILWRSALGMPLGIMGGNTAYSFADASDDYLKIPGENLKPDKGFYTMQITSELWETIYTDQLQLVAVDHPESEDVYVPEQFSPPPFPGMKIYRVSEKKFPVSATDGMGNNVLPQITEKDDIYLSGFGPDRYQGVTRMHDLILDPGDIDVTGRIYLFLEGWIFPTDASINFALSQSENLKVSAPVIQAKNKKGEWETIISNLGFPQGKDKMVIADLTGKIPANDKRIRIRTNMEIYWDQVFFSDKEPGNEIVTTIVNPSYADLHYRGFSRMFRKGGRYGPHWFDYSDVDASPKWHDLTGNYTRYGNVLPLLTKSDNKYIISNAGDEVTVKFDVSRLPGLKEGWKRDFLIRSVGWVKDGDLNTAYGKTVLPLPFHGMLSYPPSKTDIYPDDPELQKYNRKYNTRVVTGEQFLSALRK